MNVTDKFEQLKLGYLRSLAAKSAEIDSYWERVLETNFDSGALCDLKAVVHRISGSAGIYGLDDVSACAQRVDQQLTDPGDADHGWRANLEHSVRDLLKRLEESADLHR